MTSTRKRLEKIKGLSEIKVLKIKEAAAKVMVRYQNFKILITS